MDAEALISDLAARARVASRKLKASSYQERKSALGVIADAISANSERILEANQKDMTSGESSDRLLLTQGRIDAIVDGVHQVSNLPDPLGVTLRESTLPNGLDLRQVSVPFGVVGMVYEARPNVTVDAAVILLMSGNAALLRGSSNASHSNDVLVEIMRAALVQTSIPADAVQSVPSDDRENVRALLHARGKVDLVIPRGSASLIRMVIDQSTVPTIETGAGVCHVYVDEFADLKKALPILINSKTNRPSVCNAAETVLIHKSVAEEFLPMAIAALSEAGVKLHCDEAGQKVAKQLNIASDLATDTHWATEYGSLEMNVGVVDNLEEAIDHISQFGTNHTEAIISESQEKVDRFIALSDCAAVMVNTSTRFTDGEQMGFGAEIGISNQKLHARGPMGLEAMTTTSWIVTGSGQIRQ